MRETRLSGSEGGARFNPLSLPLSSQRIVRITARKLPCAARGGLLHYTRKLRMWRNWQTRYFEVVVP